MDYFRATPTGAAEWRFTWNGQTREVQRAYTIMYSKGGPPGWRILAVHIGASREKVTSRLPG